MPRDLSRERSRERDDRMRERGSRRDRSRERSPVRHDRDKERRGRDAERIRHPGRDRERDRDRDSHRIRERDSDRVRDGDRSDRDRSHRERHRSDRDKEEDDRTAGLAGRTKEARPEIDLKIQTGAPGVGPLPMQTQQNGTTETALPTLDADISPEEMQMMQAMGIPFGFDTTQGRHIEDESVNAGAVKVKQKRRARQYMNRRGGFNRALPPERTGETALRD